MPPLADQSDRPKRGGTQPARKESSKRRRADKAAVASSKAAPPLPQQGDEYTFEGLEARLARLSTYVNQRVSLIPPKHYIPKTAAEEVEQVSRYTYNKASKAPKQEVKEASKKAKRLRLHPDGEPSVPDIQASEAEALDGSAGDADMAPAEADDAAAPTAAAAPAAHIGENVPRSVLQERLFARIVELRGKRKAKEQLDSAEPKKNKKAKAKEVAAELAKKKSITSGARDRGATLGSPGGGAATTGDGAVVFSKFDFSTAARVSSKKKKGPATAMQKLAKAISDKERIAKLKSEDPDKAKELESKAKWKSALLKASGTKVRDDEKLLKRTIKRKEAAKRRTQRDWADRVNTVQKHKDDKQAKRKDNLKARAAAKIERRISRGKKPKAKPAKKRAGFEGASPQKKPKERMTLQSGYKKL